jgi:hypothetical protein
MINKKMEAPLQLTKESFINSTEENNQMIYKGKSQAVTFTLNQQDLELLERQIDRAIKLGKRNKNKSTIIRMALKSLSESTDENYLRLYDKF